MSIIDKKPTLTKEQLKAGFHIWTEFKYGTPNERIGFEHWKKLSM